MDKKMNFAEWFCILAFTSCMAYFYCLTYLALTGHAIPNEISEIKICIIGISGSVVGYVIGSSKSSKDKDGAIADALKNGNTQQPNVNVEKADNVNAVK